jgi:hypothetical protein
MANQNNSLSLFFFRITITSLILILALLFDMWVFHVVSNTYNWIYFIGLIGFISLVIGIIINIWSNFEN